MEVDVGRAVRPWLLAAAALLLASCAEPPRAVRGVMDLRQYDWNRGPAVLTGEWSFDDGWRRVPDTWSGSEAGGVDGRGSGVYRLKVLVRPDAPVLALRYRTASTALAVAADGVELGHAGHPSADRKLAVSGYAPGVVPLPVRDSFEIEVAVSNHDYRIGGLWEAPSLGPEPVMMQSRWYDEVSALVLAAALALIGTAALLLFLYRNSGKTFLHLGIFAFLVAARSLVTGEYAVLRLLPGIPYELVIRIEYLTAFLPFPFAVLFFSEFFPGMISRTGVRLMTWPSWAFAVLPLVLPLDLLTRSILWFYPVVVPALLAGTSLLVRRILVARQGILFLVGVAVLAGSGLTDMVIAAFFDTTGTLVPWGLGLFVLLQATTVTRRFLEAFDATQALLAEKDLLVKEVHHRVKNSLQVVASIVSLQANRTDDPEQKSMLKALRQRITTVSLVHEKLYGQAQGDRPDLGDYLTDLLKLQYPGGGLETNVRWHIDTRGLRAGIDYCIDVGLILTELVGNALKHAVLKSDNGYLEVTVRPEDDRLVIEVVDNGPGFPEGFVPQATKGLGYRLVLALLQRVGGTLSTRSESGARVVANLKQPGD